MHVNDEEGKRCLGAAVEWRRIAEFEFGVLGFSLLFLMAVIGPRCFAQDEGNVPKKMAWQNAGAYSYHFDRATNFRENNIGLGAEIALDSKNSIMFGSLINSERARTRYMGWQWRPIQGRVANAKVYAGVAIAAMDGYSTMRDGGLFPSLLPLVAVEGKYVGLNLSVVPTIPNRIEGAVLFQLKLRVW